MNKPIRIGLAKVKTLCPNSAGLAPVKAKQKDGNEPFHEDGKPLTVKLKHFWQWSASDLMSNASRGLLARYLVARALGLADGVRNECAPFDLETKDGMKIEVKSFSPFQSGSQGHSKLSSSIGPAHSGNDATGKFDEEIEHQADVYVLCVLGDRETDKDKVDPLNLDQWDFYVMKASLLNEESPTQTTIGEASLNKPDLIKVNYAELGARICDLSPSHGTQRTFGSPNQRRAAGYTAPKQSFGLGASTAPIPGLPLEFRSPNQRRSLVAQGNP
jgi:hypothetical protein